MSNREEVDVFLSRFKIKSKTFGIIFRGDRKQNIQTLAELEITALQRQDEVMSLNISNYSSGPIQDTLNKGDDMWVFGKIIKGKEIYIKITLGGLNNQTFCISFHIAEHKLNYPFSEKNN